MPRPARDARLRAGFVAFRQDWREMIGLWLNRDPRIVYDGLDLKRDLLAAYDRQSAACTITYPVQRQAPGAAEFRRYLAPAVRHVVRSLQLRGTALGRMTASAVPTRPASAAGMRWRRQARRVIDRDTGAMAGPGRYRYPRADRVHAGARALGAAHAGRYPPIFPLSLMP